MFTMQPSLGQVQTQGLAQPQGQPPLQNKYIDLGEPWKSQVEELEKFIKAQVQIAESIDYELVTSQIKSIHESIETTSQKLESVLLLIESDTNQMKSLKSQVHHELKHLDLSSRYLERVKVSGNQKSLASSSSHFEDPFSSYFAEFLISLQRKCQDLNSHMEELEAHVKSFKSSHSPLAIQETLKRQNQGLMGIANHVALVHDQIQKCILQFGEYSKKYTSESVLKVYQLLKSAESRVISLSDIASHLSPDVLPSTLPGNPMNNPMSSTFGSFYKK